MNKVNNSKVIFVEVFSRVVVVVVVEVVVVVVVVVVVG
jgi:hypothetical protein